MRGPGAGLTPAPSTTTLAPGTADPNCTLVLPANPLSAQGLSTPFILKASDPGGVCAEGNVTTSAFAQGAIISPDGAISLYNPLIVGDGEKAAPTIPANVPAGATVALWFGFNGTNLALASASGTNALQQGRCVDGLQGSLFSQVSYCNSPAFFQVANEAIRSGRLRVPALGNATDGKACPTVRDFSVVDQDQSDNVTTHYFFNSGVVGQQGSNVGGADLINGSDNLLLTFAIDPTVGCSPWKVPDQTNNGQLGTSLPLDELQAAAYQANPIALVPLNDPMAEVNGAASAAKTDLYRQGVDQPQVSGNAGGGTNGGFGNGGFGNGGNGRGGNGNGFGRGRRTLTPTTTPMTTAPTTAPTTSTATTTGTRSGGRRVCLSATAGTRRRTAGSCSWLLRGSPGCSLTRPPT